jgi:hypothetical protein
MTQVTQKQILLLVNSRLLNTKENIEWQNEIKNWLKNTENNHA